MSKTTRFTRLKLLFWLGLIVTGLTIYVVLEQHQWLEVLQDGTRLREFVVSLGALGPLMVIILLTAAIMISPLPSAPIAIASGAAYGHGWGAVYVLLGSLIGASGAFTIARYLGYEAIKPYAERYLPQRYYHSQTRLMLVLLLTRLLPFLSFDVLSYAAGLTPLTWWRFMIATALGIAPASFFLAHVGSEMASTEIYRIAVALLLLVVVSLGLAMLQGRHRKG